MVTSWQFAAFFVYYCLVAVDHCKAFEKTGMIFMDFFQRSIDTVVSSRLHCLKIPNIDTYIPGRIFAQEVSCQNTVVT
jgi:hypothetical protein